MLIAVSKTKDGRPLLVFGLEAGNLDKLKEGKPAFHDFAEFGLGHLGQFVIFYGETASDLRDAFAGLGAVVDERTRVIDHITAGPDRGNLH